MTESTFLTAHDAAIDRLVDSLVGGGSGEPTPGTADAPDAPASGPDGTTPAAGDGADPDAPEVNGEPAKATADAPAAPPDGPEAGFDPAKTLAKYETPEDRDRALIESQRTLIERQRENEDLRRQIEELRTKPASAPPATPPAPAETKPSAAPGTEPANPADPADERAGYKDFLLRVNAGLDTPDTLTDERERQVASVIASLKARKGTLDQIDRVIAEKVAQETANSAEIAKLTTILEAQREDLKAEADDYALQERIRRNEARLADLRRTASDLRSERIDATLRRQNEQADLDRAIPNAERFAQSVYQGLRQSATTTAAEAEVNREWDAGAKALFDTHLKADGFTPFEQKAIVAALRDKLEAELSRPGAQPPANLAEWQRAQADVIAEARANREAIQRATVGRSAATLPKKPADNVIEPPKSGAPAGKTTGRSGSPSSRNFLRESESRLDRALGF